MPHVEASPPAHVTDMSQTCHRQLLPESCRSPACRSHSTRRWQANCTESRKQPASSEASGQCLAPSCRAWPSALILGEQVQQSLEAKMEWLSWLSPESLQRPNGCLGQGTWMPYTAHKWARGFSPKKLRGFGSRLGIKFRVQALESGLPRLALELYIASGSFEACLLAKFEAGDLVAIGSKLEGS